MRTFPKKYLDNSGRAEPAVRVGLMRISRINDEGGVISGENRLSTAAKGALFSRGPQVLAAEFSSWDGFLPTFFLRESISPFIFRMWIKNDVAEYFSNSALGTEAPSPG